MAVADACCSELGPQSLAQDLARLDMLVRKRAEKPRDDASHVRAHHAAARVRQACVAPSTRLGLTLQHPFDTWDPRTVPGMVLAALRVDVRDTTARVLECGSARGLRSLYMAALAPRVRFVGIDPVCAHVAEAEKSKRRGRHANVSFTLGPGLNCDAYGSGLAGIFAVEAQRHMHTPAMRREFLQGAARALRPDARLVVVDGFRSRYFAYYDTQARCALEHAENSLHNGPLGTEHEWAVDADAAGLRLVLCQDLTPAALPFWRLRWRMARGLLHLAPLLACLVGENTRVTRALRHVVAASTTAQAMNAGVVTYGMLVFEHAVGARS